MQEPTKPLSRTARALIGAMMLAYAAAAAPPGDRAPKMNCVFPEAAFMHAGKGGRGIDVTRAPFNARGDGVTDDTDALIRAYEFVLAEMDKVDWNPAGPMTEKVEYILYLPNGTYLVSDTIIYREPWRQYPMSPRKLKATGKKVFEKLVRLRFFGQSREGAVIRLRDGCPGYQAGGKAVLSFGKADLNNAVAYNAVRNLTIDTGSGNPGAIGLDFCGANNSGLHNVGIRSEDGAGIAGIDIRMSPTMGYHDDLVISGFDVGIRMTPYHMTHNCFEYVTLTGQKQAAVQIATTPKPFRRPWIRASALSSSRARPTASRRESAYRSPYIASWHSTAV